MHGSQFMNSTLIVIDLKGFHMSSHPGKETVTSETAMHHSRNRGRVVLFKKTFMCLFMAYEVASCHSVSEKRELLMV